LISHTPKHLWIFFFFKPTTRVVFDLYNSCCTTASMNAAVHRWVCKKERKKERKTCKNE
jgi:hypothetical protein